MARKAQSAIAAIEPRAGTECAITLTIADDSETFSSPDAFLTGATPEALARFDELEVRVHGNGLQLSATFDRRARSWLGGSGGSSVHLEVRPADASQTPEAVEVARAVAVSLRRGYARYWAGCTSAPELREHAGHPLPAHGILATAVIVLVGALLGAGLARLLDDLPGVTLSSAAAIALLGAAGVGYPALVTRLVANVEVAPAGRTRLVAVGRRSAVALATFAATQVLQLLLD